MKALEAGKDPYLGFLDFPGLGTSPAQQLFVKGLQTDEKGPGAPKWTSKHPYQPLWHLHVANIIWIRLMC